MPSRVTLKAINDELARLGYTARLAKGSGYFYFQFGEAANWLDRTVAADTVNSRTLEEWIDELRRLQKLNEEIMGKDKRKKAARRGRTPRRGLTPPA